jgi:hypothetical protein
MSERKRRHDDQHWPLQGKGKRAPRSRYVPDAKLVPMEPAKPIEPWMLDGSMWGNPDDHQGN